MRRTLQRLFNLYPGEEKHAVLFAILAFVWSIGSYCGVTLADGMFLEHVGASSLPKAYFLTALGLFAVATLFLYAFHYFTPYRVYYSALVIGICVYISIFLYSPVTQSPATFWLLFKVFANILMVVLTTCFWFFIDQYYHLQNAKRLFSLFNATIFLGNACGGILLATTLNSIGIRGLISVIVTLFSLTGIWVFFLTKHTKPVNDEGLPLNQKQSFKSIWRGVIHSRFTLLLMVTYLVIQLINIVTEYTYMQSFDHYFDHNRSLVQEEGNQLTIFLGTCTAWIAIANMIFGFFFYSRTVNRFGVSNIVGISSLFFLVVFAGWSFSSALFVAILGLIVVEGISYTLDENNSNLLLNAVPTKLKNRVRVAIDSFFEPLGMLISASIFLFFDLSSKTVGLTLTLFSLALIVFLRLDYRKAIFSNLLENAIHFERKAKDWLRQMNKREQKAAKFQLLTLLKQLDEPSQIFACDTLLQFNDPKVLPRLLHHVQRMSLKGKIKVIDLIENSHFSADHQVLDRLDAWLRGHPHHALKGAIYFYLAKLGLLHPEKAFKEINSSDLVLRGASILALKKSWAQLSVGRAANNRSVAETALQELLFSSVEEDICMGVCILGLEKDSNNIELLLPFLKHRSQKVACSTILSIKQLLDKTGSRFSQALLCELKLSYDNEFRLECLKAIGKISDSSLARGIILASLHFRPSERRMAETIILEMGLKTVPILLSLTKDVAVHHRCRVLAGRILGKLALPQLKANLLEIINKEIESSYFYYYHSATIQSHYPEQDLAILQDALYTSYEAIIDFIIQLLGQAGAVEDCELLSRALHSSNAKTRSHAMETLEKSSEGTIFRLLKPLIDERPKVEKIRHYLKRKSITLSLEELLNTLQRSPSHVDQITAHSLKAKLDLPNWRGALREQMRTDEEIFHHFAYELLET